MRAQPAILATLLLAACASSPDRFYALSARPAAAVQRAAAPAVELALTVSLPSLVDRPQLVVETADGVRIQEHERWAAPLADQMQSVLGQDLERRRTDVFVTPRATGPKAVHMDVDIISLAVHVGAAVKLEVRWRVSAGAPVQTSYGRESFTCGSSDGYAAIAAAASECIAQLADRLAATLPGG